MTDNPAAVHLAAWNGDVVTLRRLLNEDSGRLYAIDPWGQLPLGLIAQRGHLDATECLVEYGVDLDRTDERGCTALMWACCRGQLRMVERLLQWGADPTVQDMEGGNALMDAARGEGGEATSVVALLLADGRINVNHRSDTGTTALKQACLAGNAEVVRVLLLTGRAEHDVMDLWGQRPMSVALAGRHQLCVQVLQWFEDELWRVWMLREARRLHDHHHHSLSASHLLTHTITHTQPTHPASGARADGVGGGGREGSSRAQGEGSAQLVDLGGFTSPDNRRPHTQGAQATPHPSSPCRSRAGKGRRRERGEEEEGEVGAVLQYVVMGLKHDLFMALLDLITYPLP